MVKILVLRFQRRYQVYPLHQSRRVSICLYRVKAEEEEEEQGEKCQGALMSLINLWIAWPKRQAAVANVIPKGDKRASETRCKPAPHSILIRALISVPPPTGLPSMVHSRMPHPLRLASESSPFPHRRSLSNWIIFGQNTFFSALHTKHSQPSFEESTTQDCVHPPWPTIPLVALPNFLPLP